MGNKQNAEYDFGSPKYFNNFGRIGKADEAAENMHFLKHNKQNTLTVATS